jgi:uncharacterized protein YaaN involved in tellurite resistance
MSDLDLGSGATPASGASAPQPGNTLVLAPPPPVVVVEKEQAAGAVPVDSTRQVELRSRAQSFAQELAALDANSPAFTEKVNAITSMGEQDMRASASVSSRMLDRPAAALNAGKGRGNADAQSRVASTLLELRQTVTELDPNRADLTGAKKVLKFLPGGDKVQRYFARYESAQTQLNAIIKSLQSGQDELRKDNASIDTEKANMWATMGKLSEYNELAAALDAAVEDKIAQLQAAGDSKKADALKADALFPIRQRRQDIMTQMAVAVQGYMALDLVRKNNIELIKGVDRAQTTTIAALRTAIIVSQALSRPPRTSSSGRRSSCGSRVARSTSRPPPRRSRWRSCRPPSTTSSPRWMPWTPSAPRRPTRWPRPCRRCKARSSVRSRTWSAPVRAS